MWIEGEAWGGGGEGGCECEHWAGTESERNIFPIFLGWDSAEVDVDVFNISG